MKEKNKKLWTKDFTCITAATVLSAVGGEAMNLPISLLVFDETGSTLLSALVMICGVLPDVIFSVLAAPLIDRGGKKRWIVALDVLTAVIYLAMGVYISSHPFHYGLYLFFVLVIGTVSVFYRLAYDAWYPELIAPGMEQKGYAVGNLVYPLVIIAMSPAAAFLYERISMAQIFFLVAGITLVSVAVESRITEKRESAAGEETYTFRAYVSDLREGLGYLRKERGIRNIYGYMSVTSGVSDGASVLTQAFYQTSPWLSVTMLGFLRSAEMIGRGLGGFFQYRWEIPVRKRYAFTKMVYTVYNVMDLILLYLPFPLMLSNRFLCGVLGISSATIRETAVMSYLPERMRARIKACFYVIFALGSIVFQFIAGILGQVLNYRAAVVLLSAFNLLCMAALIVLPAKENRPVYEAVAGSAGGEQ